MSLSTALRAQPAIAPVADAAARDRLYRHWRVRVLYSSFIGYAVFYFCRKNLSAAQPALLAELGYSKTELGTIWSLLYLAYGVSKLVNGVLGDRANPRWFMPLGLVLSALANVCFGLSSSLVMLGSFWALNGWVQGMGWPPCARLLTQWYSPNERGTTWALWNISHQVGGGAILVLAGFLTERYGWRSAFFVPAALCAACAVFLADRLRDTPESLGLPAIEAWRGDRTAPAVAGSAREILLDRVLRSRRIWFLALANFFVYLVRYGAMDWAPTFLVEVKHSTLANASYKTALFEIAGIAGALLAGRLIDTRLRHHRAAVNVAYMIGLIFAIIGFWQMPVGHPWLEGLSLAAVGFLVYGPQMLVGVLSAEAGGKSAAATATGFTGLWGYLGSIVSGAGTGYVADRYGWSGGFLLFAASAALGALCFLCTGDGERA